MNPPIAPPQAAQVAALAKPTVPGARPTLDCTTDATAVRNLPRPDTRLPRPTPRAGAAFPPTTLNQVVAYTYGRCCFNDIASTIDTATQANHRIYIAGWWLQKETWIRDKPATPSTQPYLLSDLLTQTRPAQIRTLTWKPPVVFGDIPDNQPWVDFINGLPNGAAVADAKLPGQGRTDGTTSGLAIGVHHQKIVVVVGYQGTIAFLGGMDLNNTRVHNGGVEPLHDVHLRITGPAAAQVLKTFEQRWTDHPDAAALEVTKFRASPMAPFSTAFPAQPPLAGTVPSCAQPAGPAPQERTVGIGRTYANMRKFNRTDVYGFAPDGEHSALDMVIDGIRTARSTIYLEDQYLSSAIIRTELARKLTEPGFRYLLVLITNSDSVKPAEFSGLKVYRNEYRRDLSTADPSHSRWGMYSLKPCPDTTRRWWSGEYVHSKTWIFDDQYVIIGSANCTDRSFTFDTEIVAGISESGLVRPGPDTFAMALRINLWHKHLGLPHSLVRTWDQGIKAWRNPPPAAMVYDNANTETDPDLNAAFPTNSSEIDAGAAIRSNYDPNGL